MSDDSGQSEYLVREAVGIFPDAEALEAAVDELERQGFDRSTISVLASDHKVMERVGRLYRSAAAAADDPQAPQAAFISRDSRTEAAAATVGGPLLIGGFAGAFTAAASGGALAMAIATAIAGGVVGAGLGALVLLAVARRHADHVKEQLAQGGLVVWVTTPDPVAEERAMSVLNKCGARLAHIHEVKRQWGVKDVPLYDVQPDPLLDRDPRK